MRSLYAVPGALGRDVELNFLSYTTGTAKKEALRFHATSPLLGSKKILLQGYTISRAGSFLA